MENGSCSEKSGKPEFSFSLILDILVPLQSLGRYQPKTCLKTSSSLGLRREFGRENVFKPLTPVISVEGHLDLVSLCLSGFSLDKAKHLGICPVCMTLERALG